MKHQIKLGIAILFAIVCLVGSIIVRQNNSAIATNSFTSTDNETRKIQHRQTTSQLQSNKKSDDKEGPEKPSKKLDPKSAEQQLKQAKLIKNLKDRNDACRNIMRQLCESGYTEDAWRLIDTDPGSLRDGELWAFFSFAQLDPKSATELMSQLNDSKEKEKATQSYLSSRLLDTPDILNNPAINAIIENLKASNPQVMINIIGNATRMSFDRTESDADKEKLNAMMLNFKDKGLISNEVLSTMVIRNQNKDPFELWSWISETSIGSENSSKIEVDVRHGLIQKMIFEDPKKTISSIVQNQKNLGDSDLFHAVSMWAENNPREASNWYNSQPNLTTAQSDQSAKAFAEYEIKYSELKNAENWAKQIQDIEIRSAVLEKIQNAMMKP